MSSSTERCPIASPQLARTTGAALVVRLLERQGVRVVAGIPGGALLPLYEALARSRIRHILARHEQAAGFIAQGMARMTGKAGVCFATSGPGVTNMVTALADAKLDSIPLVCIAGQVPQHLIGTDAFQEVPTIDIVRPITKATFFVRDADELPAIIRGGFPSRRDRPAGTGVDRCAQGRAARDRRCSRLVHAAIDASSRRCIAFELLPQVASAYADAVRIDSCRRTAGALHRRWRRESRGRMQLVRELAGTRADSRDDDTDGARHAADRASAQSRHARECMVRATPIWRSMSAICCIAIGARFDDRATGRPDRFAAESPHRAHRHRRA